jgi:hypothetical protein
MKKLKPLFGKEEIYKKKVDSAMHGAFHSFYRFLKYEHNSIWLDGDS